MLLLTILFFHSFLCLPIFIALPDFEGERNKVVAFYLGAVGLSSLVPIVLMTEGIALAIGFSTGVFLILTAITSFLRLDLKTKEWIEYLISNKATKFYLDYQKNRRGEVLQDYDEIQTMINYVVDNKLQKYQYATFIAHLYYGYYKMLFDKEMTRFYHSYEDNELYVIRRGLKMSALNPFDTDKCSTNEVEILVTKYKTSIDIIRSMIGKELSEETKQRIEDIWQSFAEDLEKGIEEVQRVKEMIKKQEHEAYELEQKRLQELLKNEINWLRSDK